MEAAGASLRRGPPKIPKLQRIIGTPDLRRGIGESEQEYKFRLAGERYASVTGETEQEADMVDFFKQVLASDSRGVITSFALSIIVSRHWGRYHHTSDTSLVTIAKTEKQLVQWMHPNHFAPFVARSKDHHDLIHNGFLALTIAVSNIKTLLNTGNKLGAFPLGCLFLHIRQSTFCSLQSNLISQFGTRRSSRRASTRRWSRSMLGYCRIPQ